MSCPGVDAISAFASGVLGAIEREAVECHIDACVACRISLSEAARGAVSAAVAANPHECVGRYAILRELGAGAMGVVFLARDGELDREVAIKLVQPQTAEPEGELVQQRMLREGRALARIDHPNVVRVFDAGRWRGALFVAMELAPGVTLRAWLAERRRSTREIVGVFAQCAAGLAAAHSAGVIHRDFKPENVIVDDAGRARVTDFGLAQTIDALPTPAGPLAIGSIESPLEPRLTRTHGIVGTPAYMAPEQHRGRRLDERADQFALCVALAEALGGQRPFAGATGAEALASMMAGRLALAPAIPARLRRVLARGLAYDPCRRYPSMSALGNALARPCRPWRWVAGSGLLVAVGLVVAIATLSLVPERGWTRVAASTRVLALQEHVLRAEQRSHGDRDHSAGIAHLNLAATLIDRGDAARALAHAEQALAIFERTVGADHALAGAAHSAIAIAMLLRKQPREAIAHARRASEIHEAAGAGALVIAASRFDLAQAYAAIGQSRDALAAAHSALALAGDSASATAIRAWIAERER